MSRKWVPSGETAPNNRRSAKTQNKTLVLGAESPELLFVG